MDEVQNTLRLIHVSLNKTSDCRYVPLSSKHTDICWCWSYGKIILQLVSVWQIYQLIAINTPKHQAYLHNFGRFDLPECRRATSFLKTRKTRQLMAHERIWQCDFFWRLPWWIKPQINEWKNATLLQTVV